MNMSLVSAALAMQVGNTQMQIAASLMKKNADAEKSAVLRLLGAGQPSSQANLAAGVGANSTFCLSAMCRTRGAAFLTPLSGAGIQRRSEPGAPHTG